MSKKKAFPATKVAKREEKQRSPRVGLDKLVSKAKGMKK